MNVPVFIIGIVGVVLGLVVMLRGAIVTDLFRRDADRQGHPRELFTRTTVLIGGIAVCLVGIYCVAIGVNG